MLLVDLNESKHEGTFSLSDNEMKSVKKAQKGEIMGCRLTLGADKYLDKLMTLKDFFEPEDWNKLKLG